MKKILLVEDDRTIGRALTLRLKSLGYEVTIAQDALTGLHSAVRLRPDLVLMDISMPAGNGFVVAERIQSLVPTAAPIIFITASKRPDFRRKAEDIGAVGFFEKPFELSELVACIRQALGEAPPAQEGPAAPAHPDPSGVVIPLINPPEKKSA